MAQLGSIEGSSPGSLPKRWALVRLILGFLQMFGAVFSMVLVILLGVVPWSLASLIATGLVTTASIILFGKQPFGIIRKRMENKR